MKHLQREFKGKTALIIFGFLTLIIIAIGCNNSQKNVNNSLEKVKPIINGYCDSLSKYFPKLKYKNIFVEKVDSAEFEIFKGTYMDVRTIYDNKLIKTITNNYKYKSNNVYFISFDRKNRNTIKTLPFLPLIHGDFSVLACKIYHSNDTTFVKYIDPWPELKWSSVLPPSEVEKLHGNNKEKVK